MRIPSGSVDRYLFFVAVDATDLKTRETGLSSFTVYRSRNGAAAAAFTTPTVNQTDVTNMPGVYELLMDEDTTLDSGKDEQEMVVHITHAGMAPVSRAVEIYRPKATEGETVTATSGRASADTTHWGGTAVASANVLIDGAITAAKIAADAIGASELAADAAVEIAAAVWDRVITGANHNITNSAGKRLRELTNSVVTSGTAQAGSTNTITLAAGASSSDGTYDPALVRISGGTGAGQARLVLHYTGATRVAVVDRDWRTTPDNTSEYEVLAAPNLISTNEGLAQGGGASTITLNTDASAVNDSYVGETIVLRTGTGQDQARLVTAYNGTTKVATVSQAWVTPPTSSSAYIVWPVGRAMVGTFVDGAITAAAFSAGAIDAAAIATNAIGADELAASAITEMQSGLATASAVSTLQTSVDDLPTNAELATALAAADDAVLAAIAALNNLSAAQVTAAVPTATQNADALLKRDFSAVTGEATRSALNALRFLRNKWGIAGGTLTVTTEDDTTTAWTAVVTQTAGDPVSQIDPA